VRGQHHLTSAFEDLDFLPHGPRLSIGVRRGCGGVDGLAGCGNVEVEGAEGPGPAADAQVEGESAEQPSSDQLMALALLFIEVNQRPAMRLAVSRCVSS
jgi:hypothetical protein